jgi:hypothetical protein
MRYFKTFFEFKIDHTNTDGWLKDRFLADVGLSQTIHSVPKAFYSVLECLIMAYDDYTNGRQRQGHGHGLKPDKRLEHT